LDCDPGLTIESGPGACGELQVEITDSHASSSVTLTSTIDEGQGRTSPGDIWVYALSGRDDLNQQVGPYNVDFTASDLRAQPIAQGHGSISIPATPGLYRVELPAGEILDATLHCVATPEQAC
jgi:hypothetical protein